MAGARQPPIFSHVPVCLPSTTSGNRVLIVGNAVSDSAPPPHGTQVDAGRGLLAAAARCALCISPVMGLTDRKRLVQQLTQNETSAELPANICIGYLAGSTGPTGLLRASVSDRPCCADLTNILPSFFFVLDADSAYGKTTGTCQ
jgi:hypothetical protein